MEVWLEVVLLLVESHLVLVGNLVLVHHRAGLAHLRWTLELLHARKTHATTGRRHHVVLHHRNVVWKLDLGALVVE